MDELFLTLGPVIEAGYAYTRGNAVPAARGGAKGSFIASAALDVGLLVPGPANSWITADALFGFAFQGLRGLADEREVAGTAGGLAMVRAGLALGQ